MEKGFPKFAVYEEGKPGYVYINKTQYFEAVPAEVWEFRVGGYQVCEKWLKDRRGRQPSFDDLMHPPVGCRDSPYLGRLFNLLRIWIHPTGLARVGNLGGFH